MLALFVQTEPAFKPPVRMPPGYAIAQIESRWNFAKQSQFFRVSGGVGFICANRWRLSGPRAYIQIVKDPGRQSLSRGCPCCVIAQNESGEILRNKAKSPGCAIAQVLTSGDQFSRGGDGGVEWFLYLFFVSILKTTSFLVKRPSGIPQLWLDRAGRAGISSTNRRDLKR